MQPAHAHDRGRSDAACGRSDTAGGHSDAICGFKLNGAGNCFLPDGGSLMGPISFFQTI